MYQGTTPIIPLTFKGVDLSEAKIYLTMADGCKKTRTFVSGEDFEVTFDGTDTTGTIRLTQEQTLNMSAGAHTVQARWVFPDGSAGASKKTTAHVNEVLLKDVISYDG